MRDTIFGVAAANDQRHDDVEVFPACNAGTVRNDRSSDFKSRNVGGAGRWRIEAHALHDVGPVDAGGRDFDQDLAGTRFWYRPMLGLQHLRSAGFLDLYDGHAFG